MKFAISLFLIFCVKFSSSKNETITNCQLHYMQRVYQLTFSCDGNNNSIDYFNPNIFLFYCSNFGTFYKRYVNEVNFKNCKLSRIKYPFWENFAFVNILNLSAIELEVLPNDFFNGAKQLETLIVSNNHLTEIPSSQFIHTPKLRNVDYSFNHISEVNEMAFMGAVSIRIINLSNNNIHSINTNTFKPLINLEILNLSFNRFVSLQIGTFTAPKLISLDLSHNRLKNIDFGTESVNLEAFYIDENELNELIGFNRSQFPNLKSWSITGNQFKCTYLQDFFDSLHNSSKDLINIVHSADFHKTNVNGIPCNLTQNAVRNEAVNPAIRSLPIILCILVVLVFAIRAGKCSWQRHRKRY